MIRRMSLTLAITAAAAALTVPMSAVAVAPTEPQGPSAAAVQAVEAAGITVNGLKPGWTVKGQEIVWPDGTMASLGPMAYEDCAAGYLCFWEDSSYGGRRLQFQDTGLRSNMADYSFNDQMSSWRSRRSLDARWYYNTGGRWHQSMHRERRRQLQRRRWWPQLRQRRDELVPHLQQRYLLLNKRDRRSGGATRPTRASLRNPTSATTAKNSRPWNIDPSRVLCRSYTGCGSRLRAA